MMMHDIFGEDLFDDFMDDFAFPAFPDTEKALYGKHAKNLMKTDVKETDSGYELEMDLPGFKKDEITVGLENGLLTIRAAKGLDQDEKSDKYIRKERYAGVCERSFYVGDALTEEDIKGQFQDGVLTLRIPKKDARVLPEKRYIAIED